MPESVEHLQRLLQDRGFNESVIFNDPDFISAVVGVSEDGNVIYDRDKMIDILVAENGMSVEQADEWITDNCDGYAYSGYGQTPILIHQF